MFTEQQFQIPPLKGISAQTIQEHLKLYAGYVKNANSVVEKLALYQKDETKIYEMGELYRHFSFEYNGMRNHEVYFSLLAGVDTDDSTSLTTSAPTLHAAINAQWNDMTTFASFFSALALTRGIGWAMLSYDQGTKALIMHWVDEQHLGQLQGTTPVIALDMWEHSFVADYLPSGKKQYIADFMDNLNWACAEAFYTAAAGTR